MKEPAKRLRMFAGPNGSGKTTVKNSLQRPPDWFGIYINPDELEETIARTGRISLASFGFKVNATELRSHFASSTLLQRHQLQGAANQIDCHGTVAVFEGFAFNSYHASVLADFLRRKALSEQRSFSFETVMSSSDKIELLRDAQALGYRTYLYYIATEDPEINIQRVRNRVAEGGHDVPKDKVITRYHRSLNLLNEAIRYTNRAYFFDTSEEEALFFAEATDGKSIELKAEEMPYWFQSIWDRF